MKPWSQTHPRAFLLVIAAGIFIALNLVTSDAPVIITRSVLAFTLGLTLGDVGIATREKRRARR